MALTAWLSAGAARAADHADGPAVRADPTTDIADLFAWMSSDGMRLQLVLDVSPAANKATSKFSNAAKYAIHVHKSDKYFGTAKGAYDLICTFDVAQNISCWVIDKQQNDKVLEYVTGSASDPTKPLTSSDGKLQVFAGPRDDPFFFYLNGFTQTANAVTAAAGVLQFDANGCPQLPMTTSQQLVQLLNGQAGGPAADHFHGMNVLSIVVSMDKLLVSDAANPILGVWASTNK
jgi:hypothetical protein